MRQYAVVLIKPDAVNDILDGLILQDIQNQTGATPIFRKFWKITEESVELIYPRWIDRPEFPSMVHNLTFGESLLIVVSGEDDLYKSLRQVKGRTNVSGLRLKYRLRSNDEWKALGYSGESLRRRIGKNRLHTTDDFEETVKLCSLALTCRDLLELELTAASLVSAIRRRKALQTQINRP